jgi:hypothetical protein
LTWWAPRPTLFECRKPTLAIECPIWYGFEPKQSWYGIRLLENLWTERRRNRVGRRLEFRLTHILRRPFLNLLDGTGVGRRLEIPPYPTNLDFGSGNKSAWGESRRKWTVRLSSLHPTGRRWTGPQVSGTSMSGARGALPAGTKTEPNSRRKSLGNLMKLVIKKLGVSD